MRLTFDSEADAAYIRIVDPIENGAAIKQITVHHPNEENRTVYVLDFDAEGSLLGIEILGARTGLRHETLAQVKNSS